jgi:hypothetical protein
MGARFCTFRKSTSQIRSSGHRNNFSALQSALRSGGKCWLLLEFHSRILITGIRVVQTKSLEIAFYCRMIHPVALSLSSSGLRAVQIEHGHCILLQDDSPSRALLVASQAFGHPGVTPKAHFVAPLWKDSTLQCQRWYWEYLECCQEWVCRY